MRYIIYAQSEKNVILKLENKALLRSSLIWLMRKLNGKYAELLLNCGVYKNNQTLKYFCYSDLNMNILKIKDKKQANVSDISFMISIPADHSLKHFLTYIFKDKWITLGDKEKVFQIVDIDSMDEPDIDTNEELICLSPIAVAIKNKNQRHYLNYMNPDEHERFVEKIHENLIKKYEDTTGKSYTKKSDFRLEFDEKYIEHKKGIIHKCVPFLKYSIVVNSGPFKVHGDPELLKIGYDYGFGLHNSFGFGMVEKKTFTDFKIEPIPQNPERYEQKEFRDKKKHFSRNKY